MPLETYLQIVFYPREDNDLLTAKKPDLTRGRICKFCTNLPETGLIHGVDRLDPTNYNYNDLLNLICACQFCNCGRKQTPPGSYICQNAAILETIAANLGDVSAENRVIGGTTKAGVPRLEALLAQMKLDYAADYAAPAPQPAPARQPLQPLQSGPTNQPMAPKEYWKALFSGQFSGKRPAADQASKENAKRSG